jgi:hypothetical protein
LNSLLVYNNYAIKCDESLMKSKYGKHAYNLIEEDNNDDSDLDERLNCYATAAADHNQNYARSIDLNADDEHYNVSHLKTYLKLNNKSLTNVDFATAADVSSSPSLSHSIAAQTNTTTSSMRAIATNSSPLQDKLKEEQEKKLFANINKNFLLHNINIDPMLKLGDVPFYTTVKDYLNMCGITRIKEFDWYCWPVVLRGRHLVAIPNESATTTTAFVHDGEDRTQMSNSINKNQLGGECEVDYDWASKQQQMALSYLCPLMSVMFEELEMNIKEQYEQQTENEKYKNKKQQKRAGGDSGERAAVKKETGFVKNVMYRSENGPLLLIVCESCKSAQIVFEIVNRIIELNGRMLSALYKQQVEQQQQQQQQMMMLDDDDSNLNENSSMSSEQQRENTTVHEASSSSSSFRVPKPRNLRALLIQGGGFEGQYDIALANGCDILISATPYCILRMIGNMRTNLERLQYLVLNEANVLLERFPRQIQTLMHNYSNLLRLNEKQSIAQFLLFSAQWSLRVRTFVDSYMLDPVVLITNKLEASNYGQVHHVVSECMDTSDKLRRFQLFIENLSNVHNQKNTIVMTKNNMHCKTLFDTLAALGYSHIACINEQSKQAHIDRVEQEWAKWTPKKINSSTVLSSKNNNLILVCVESMLKCINISNAQCVLHYDFAPSKSSFGERLWLMRNRFPLVKEFTVSTWSSKSQLSVSSSSAITPATLNTKVNNKNIIKNKSTKNETDIEEEEDDSSSVFESRDESQFVDNDRQRITSYVLLTEDDKHYSEGLLNYLLRIGVEKKYLPSMLFDMANKRREKKEAAKSDRSLCAFIKSYGKCMASNFSANNCPYRHKLDPFHDQLHYLDDEFRIPNEGFIEVKRQSLIFA